MRDMLFRVLKLAGTYLSLSVVFGLITLGALYPDIPETAQGWLMLFLFSLPAWLIAEAFGQVLWSNRIARRIDDATRAQSFSPARVAYGLVAILLSIGLVAGAVYGWNVMRSEFGF